MHGQLRATSVVPDLVHMTVQRGVPLSFIHSSTNTMSINAFIPEMTVSQWDNNLGWVI